jgi:hypothetical protein
MFNFTIFYDFMQINNKIKWSILIWAVFLSLVISISFMSISTKINKSIQNNSTIQKNSNFETTIKNKDYTDKDLWNNEEIIFDSNKSYKKTLNLNENTEIRIINNTNNTDFSITINSWWPIFYNFTSFNGTTASWQTSSWIIEKIWSFTWYLDSNYNNGILYIKNLWWYTNFDLTSTQDITTQYKKYKINKNIWNKTLIKKEWSIKIFDLWDFNWIDYKKQWFYF